MPRSIFNRNKGYQPTKKDTDMAMVPPKIPILFGNSFRIQIRSGGEDSYSNFFHQSYKLGLGDIFAEISIKQYLIYYFKKMTNLKIVETLESLASDYPHSFSTSHSLWIEFALNKTQTLEFLDLIEKASRGLDI